MKFLQSLQRVDFKNKKVQVAIGLVLIGIFVGGGYYYLFLEPKKIVIQSLIQTRKEKQDELNAILSMITHREKLHKNVVLREAELDSLRSIFPDRKEIPQLIHNITKLAHKTGIITQRFNPLPDVVKEFYIENRYTMSVFAGYHELALFFNYLAELDLIINLTDVSIRTNPNLSNSILNAKDQGYPIHSLVASFNMTTFSSKK